MKSDQRLSDLRALSADQLSDELISLLVATTGDHEVFAERYGPATRDSAWVNAADKSAADRPLPVGVKSAWFVVVAQVCNGVDVLVAIATVHTSTLRALAAAQAARNRAL